MAWITTKSGKHINTDWFDDERTKERQIAANKAEADRLNGKVNTVESHNPDYDTLKDYYSKFRGDSSKCCMELYKRTGIDMSGDLNIVDDDTLVETCATLEDLQNKFRINQTGKEKVEASLNGKEVEGVSLEVKVPTYYDHEFEGEHENEFAHAKLGKISLNSKYYSLHPKELDEMFQEGTQGSENFHPKGTSARGIIAHECAHHMLNQWVWDKYCKDKDDFYEKYHEIYNFLMDKTEYSAMGEKTAPEIKEIFGKFDKVRKQYIKKLKKDPEAVKYLGSYLGDKPLRYMANPFNYGHYGISGYSAKNYHELLAESFQDYYENGKNSRLLSQMLVKEFFGFK